MLDVFPSEAGIAERKNRKYALRHAEIGNGQRYTLAVSRLAMLRALRLTPEVDLPVPQAGASLV